MESESARTLTEDGAGRRISGSPVHPSADAVGARQSARVQGDGSPDDTTAIDDIAGRSVQRTERIDTTDPEGSDGVPDGDPLGPGQRTVPGSEEVSEGAVTRTRRGDVANKPIRTDQVVDINPDGLELPIY